MKITYLLFKSKWIHRSHLIYLFLCCIALNPYQVLASNVESGDDTVSSVVSINTYDSGSEVDTSSKAYKKSQKMERLFTYIPVPLYFYSTEAGHTYGLAKFNLFDIYDDTVTNPAKFSGVFTTSTKGRVNFSLSTEFPFRNNKYILLSYINYKKTPEYIFGIGNDVSIENKEEVTVNRFKYYGYVLFKAAKNIFVGFGGDIATYYDIKTDSNSFLIKNNVNGLNGGLNVGFGGAFAYDTRDSRYNSYKGAYVQITSALYRKAIGSAYDYNRFSIDARKFYNPWLKHVIALQVATDFTDRDVPFYEMAMLGGDAQMRGYYKGALRDKVLIDGQVEYRMPVWRIFGVVGWLGAGRVAPSYSDMSFDKVWISYGLGLRIKVDTKHNTNLRLDYGRGIGDNIHAFNISFAEAF